MCVCVCVCIGLYISIDNMISAYKMYVYTDVYFHYMHDRNKIESNPHIFQENDDKIK